MYAISCYDKQKCYSSAGYVSEVNREWKVFLD